MPRSSAAGHFTVVQNVMEFHPHTFSIRIYTLQLQKNNIETGRGYWKSLAAAPLGVSCMRLQEKPGLHVK